MTEREVREQFEYAWKNTKIIRHVERSLFTFGDSTLPYYIVAEAILNKNHTVVREGEVVVKRPMVYTPYADSPVFEGFGDKEKESAFFIIQRLAYIPPYKYQNDSKHIYVSPSPLDEAVQKLNQRLDSEDNRLVAIIKGAAEMWEVSVMRYAIERMVKSMPSNITELKEKGFLET